MSSQDDEHLARIATSYADWLKQRNLLEAYRVRPGDRRTTGPPRFDVGALFQELAEQWTTTVRLHPRYGDEPSLYASKMGGTFLWPANEPWPVCPTHNIPLVTILQLCFEDFPEMPFPPASDVFQLLWCPREHEPPIYWADLRFYWRNRSDILVPRTDNPLPREAYYEYVPIICQLLPERVREYPSVYELSEDVVERIYDWQDINLTADGVHACNYEMELSVCPGTKVGGYLHWIQSPFIPTCDCGRLMEHLLTIESMDGAGDGRWSPLEEHGLFASFPSNWQDWNEQQKAVQFALASPTGLSLGDSGHMQLFVCRHCPTWPVESAIESC